MIFHRNETTVICAVNYSRGYSIACDSGQFSYIRIFVLLFLARSLCIARSPCLSYVRDACANGSISRTREIAPRLVILGSFSKRAIRYIKSAAEARIISFHNERDECKCTLESTFECRL